MRIHLVALSALAALSVPALSWAQETTAAVEPPAAAPAAPADLAEPAAPAIVDGAAPVAEDAALVAEASAPAAPVVALPAGISPPPEGKGQIVFFRPSRFVGAALSFTVRENEAALGRLPNGRYFVHVADEGIHEYEIGRNDTMRMEIEPGETYYAMQNTQMGIVAGRAVLTPSDQAAFEAAVGRMRVSEPVAAE